MIGYVIFIIPIKITNSIINFYHIICTDPSIFRSIDHRIPITVPICLTS